MDRLRIAVIDTGVDPSHPSLPPVVGGARLSLSREGEVLFGQDSTDTHGHGTATAGVACRGLTSRLALLAIRVVDDDGTSTVRLIEAAIAWAVARGARVINVSLGAPVWGEDARARLEAVCSDARRRGVVIVAAAGPEGTRALPASLGEVISVGSAVCPREALYVADDEGVDFLAHGDLQRIPWLRGETVLGQGTSLAAAHVTNAVCRALLCDPALDPDGVKVALSARAIEGDSLSRSERRRRVDTFYRGRSAERVRWMKRAAIYPFNKETHSLVRFRHLLSFGVEAVADPPGKRLSGRDAGEVLGEPRADLPILPSYDMALARADSVVLGHIEAQTAGPARRVLGDLVRRAIERGLGVYSFSSLDGPELAPERALAAERGVPLVDPTIADAEVVPLFSRSEEPGQGFRDPRRAVRENLRVALLHDCPVLGVFGTSRSQGKLSLQLALRARLTEMGYRVSHLSTEPTGMLFGASATLPTGYERGNGLSIDRTASLTRLVMTEIKNRERPDIVLVGGQSGMVALGPDLHHLGLGSLATLGFAAAAAPDASILVANLFDPPEHVERCRAALESVVQCRVLAVAFGDQVWEERPWRGVTRRRKSRLPAGDLAPRLAAWEQRLGVPCRAVLSGADQQALAEIVVEHFAAAGEGRARAL
jgi:uncharacterized NAD-dependent epimerase/dehydratase family protein